MSSSESSISSSLRTNWNGLEMVFAMMIGTVYWILPKEKSPTLSCSSIFQLPNWWPNWFLAADRERRKIKANHTPRVCLRNCIASYFDAALEEIVSRVCERQWASEKLHFPIYFCLRQRVMYADKMCWEMKASACDENFFKMLQISWKSFLWLK